ncbi:alpha-xylosidase [Microbacterium marinilacus]|uniref:Alpha-xylosidase n=1 Tax=Microbacterium marinilacus TaxID=415209 RepID=A0ABP7BA61_9MICO|nr:alpha-xylosidase [Microbacterium marinilacus]MBY0687269.1 alpha-xylosidase [Microbacterium marinilacus]
MKFTDGFWQLRPGVDALYGREAFELRAEGRALVALVPTKVVERRGDTLNRPVLTVTLTSPLAGVIGVRIEHHRGGRDERGFDLVGAEEGHGEVVVDGEEGRLVSGDVTAVIRRGAPWSLEFRDTATGRLLTSSGEKSLGYMRIAPGAQVDPGIVGNARAGTDTTPAAAYVHEQLGLGVGELVYGLGERFGPLVKNGQAVDIWNADGGTSSEQAYKNVPFYVTNRGYGVLVDHPGHVSFEVGSEAVERVQFSAAGETLEYFVLAGEDPAAVLERYTALTGRPPTLPEWSYGLWLSTSFTTSYDEATVTSFIDGMAERDIPLEVFHFDCFWMRDFGWCDFEWDPRVFPDPEGMLARLHERGLAVCVWINPYIAQRSPLFDEGLREGYLVRRPDGSVWQWDLWQAGMALVDFTNPDARSWYQGHLRRLLRQGVDCFKTDFGERIPLDVVYADGSDPERMHNLYAQLYNEAVFEVLREERGEGEAVVFARSATAGGQRMPVHWGGDSTSSFASMAETLRGGLSLAFSGFAHWSHDIGGFEGLPDPAVFKRWVAFGLLSSHSRLHGSDTYRVPWLFDEAEGRDEADPQSAVSVLRRFTTLKRRLRPYLVAAGDEAAATGVPVMRPMALAFPDDPGAAHLDRQYLLGPDLLVAPVFTAEGDVELYLPEGRWTSLLTGETVEGGGWRRERHGFDSLPLYARAGSAVIGLASDDADAVDVVPTGGDVR